MSKEDDLRDVMDETAKGVAELQANPRTWLSWVLYLLERLEKLATNENPADKEAFIEMLTALQSEIRNRKQTGGWH